MLLTRLRRIPWRMLLTLGAVGLIGLASGMLLRGVWLDMRGWLGRNWRDFPWTAIAGIAAASAALLTLAVNQRQFNRRLEYERAVFDDRLAEDRAQMERRLAQDREIAERKSRQDEYADILNRLAGEGNVAMRVSAALRLSELAVRPIPGQPPDHVPANYPYFRITASQLAVALTTESEPLVRDTVGTALRGLADFASATPKQPFLAVILEELVHANRRMVGTLAVALQSYARLPESETDDADGVGVVVRLSRVLPLCGDIERDASWIEAMIRSPQPYRPIAQSALFGVQAGVSGVDDARDDLAAIARAGERLRVTRDALAMAIRARTPYGDDPWAEAPLLDLEGVFLAGAVLPRANLVGAKLHAAWMHALVAVDVDLRGGQLARAMLASAQLSGARLLNASLQDANLVGANLVKADFTGSDLRNAVMDRAWLNSACFIRADLRRVSLQSASLQEAQFQEAYMRDAILHEANLMNADLRGARLRATNFDGADLQGADLRGAYLRRTRMEGTLLYGARIDGTTKVIASPVGKPNYANSMSGEVDTALEGMLQGLFWTESRELEEALSSLAQSESRNNVDEKPAEVPKESAGVPEPLSE